MTGTAPGGPEQCSSQMRSSHHGRGRGRLCEDSEESKRTGRQPKRIRHSHDITKPSLPPASGRQPFGVHLAHVAHANQSHDEIFHPRGDDGRRRRSHCECYVTGAEVEDIRSHAAEPLKACEASCVAASRRKLRRCECGGWRKKNFSKNVHRSYVWRIAYISG